MEKDISIFKKVLEINIENFWILSLLVVSSGYLLWFLDYMENYTKILIFSFMDFFLFFVFLISTLFALYIGFHTLYYFLKKFKFY